VATDHLLRPVALDALGPGVPGEDVPLRVEEEDGVVPHPGHQLAEVFLALPWLYLLFAVRAFLPLHVAPNQVFMLLIAVIGMIGWARPARLIRGVVLCAKEREYVLAARGFGASDMYILRRHILPQISGVALTQAAVFIPRYVLAEVALSFLGLGVTEPAPSWGNLLAALQQYQVLESYWWMLFPALTLIPVFLGYYSLLGYYAVQHAIPSRD